MILSTIIRKSYTTCRKFRHHFREITQNGTLKVKTTGDARINIITTWQEHCTIASIPTNVLIKNNGQNNSLDLVASDDGTNSVPVLELDIEVPEYLNIVLVVSKTLDLELKKKLQGDLHITCSGGNINIDKVKGASIALECGKGNILVHKSLEGNISSTCASFFAKLIHAGSAAVTSSEQIKIGSLYCDRSRLKALKDVSIDVLRGYADVDSVEGNIDIKNIDGAFIVRSEKGNISLQVNQLVGLDYTQHSEAHAQLGNVYVQLDAQIDTSIEANILGINPDLQLEVDSFEGNRTEKFLKGRIIGKTAPSTKLQSGKINTNQSSAQSSGTLSTGVKTGLVLSCFHVLKLQTLSWMDAIKRRHGLL